MHVREARADEEANAVQAAQEAFKTQGDSFPWYDPLHDQPRPLQVTPYEAKDDPNRRSSWENLPSTTTPVTPPTTGTGTGSSLFSLPVFDLVGLSVLGLLIVGLCVYLAWAFFRDEDDEETAGFAGAAPRSGEVDRVSELPMQVGNVRGDFLSAARRENEAGNYSQAVIYLFSYELLQLDRQQIIRLAKGKTNRQYLREVRTRPELRTVFETTMIAFEDVFFGKHKLDRRQFEACWNHVDDFHRLLEGATP